MWNLFHIFTYKHQLYTISTHAHHLHHTKITYTHHICTISTHAHHLHHTKITYTHHLGTISTQTPLITTLKSHISTPPLHHIDPDAPMTPHSNHMNLYRFQPSLLSLTDGGTHFTIIYTCCIGYTKLTSQPF